jgi:hypothetical protein
MNVILTAFVAFISMFIPGVLLALALLKNTKLHIFEIIVIGFIIGFVAPATLTWMESYLIHYIHAFSFSLWLFELNILIISAVALALCIKEGVFDDIFKMKLNSKKAEEKQIIVEEKEIERELTALRMELGRFEKAKGKCRARMSTGLPPF